MGDDLTIGFVKHVITGGILTVALTTTFVKYTDNIRYFPAMLTIIFVKHVITGKNLMIVLTNDFVKYAANLAHHRILKTCNSTTP